MQEMRDEIKTTLISKRELLLQEERLYTDQVAEILGVTRRTIVNYRKSGDLPEPQRDLSDRPYWTADELERVLIRRGIKTKLPV